MKRKNYFLGATITLILTIFSSVGIWAQSSVVSVGSTTYGHSYLPSYPNGRYATSQQIYTSSEIGKAGQITSIAFYNWDTGSKRNYDIYLSHTSKTTFASTSDWITVAESNKVYSGTVWLVSGWTVIDLDTPFQYDGTQSLLLTVDDNTGQSTGYNHNIGAYDTSGHQTLFYYDSANLDPTQTITEEGVFYPAYSSSERKNGLQLCFETYPKPYRLEAVEVGDVSAQIQWSLRGGATATNLRYRKVGDTNWITSGNLTTRSKTIEGLTATTQYEAQVQAVFAGGNKSDWTDALVFSTNCCSVDQQSTVNYALRSNYTSWFGFAVQVMDITDAGNPFEAAYLHAPSYELYTGSISLCSGHTYQVNWIYDAEHENVNHAFTFSLTYGNGDALYTMDYDEAPSETSTLTTFVMDDGDFDFIMPTQLTADETYQDATLGWMQSDNAKQWLVTYSKDPDFDPDEPEEDNIVLADKYPFVLSGLEENTTYYYAVRAVEVEDATAAARSGMTRAAKKVRILKNGKIRVKVGDKWVTKSINKLSRSKIKKILKSCDRKSRPKELDAIVKLKELSPKKTYSLRSEFPKARGEETRYNILTKTVTGEGTDVPLDDIKSRVLKGNPEGIKKHTVSITSETTKGGFDNVIFISAKKGSEVSFVMSQGKTGLTHEPYAVGWISNKKLGISKTEDIEDKTKVPDETLKKLLDENQRYEVKQPTETNMTKKIVEANDDTEGVDKAPQKATDETGEDGVVFIRHNTDGGGYLRVQEAKVTEPENVKEWTSVSLPEGQMGHTDENVPPGSTILMKSEPVYKDGTTGLNSPVTIVTTPSDKLAPLPGLFSVAPGKTVYFSKSNLSGWRYDDDFSLSEKQYTMKGTANMSEGNPADEVDLYAWSTPKDYYGTAYGYGNVDENVVNRFRGSFVEWGGSKSVISLIGGGWQTLTGSEWQYVLNERANATNRKAVATVADVKGLVLLPDEWTAPSGVSLTSGGTYTDEQWTTLEKAGAVFLPAAGLFNDGLSLSDVGTKGYYWSSTPSDAKASATVKDDAYMMTFDGSGSTNVGIVSRRTGGAVRLVMCDELSVTTAASGFTTLVSNATLNLAGTEGLTGYYATHVDDASSEVTMTSISLVPANTPVVLKGSPNTTYRVKATVTSNTPPADNLLKGSATESTELAAGEAYILSGGKFVRNNAGTMPAGKAYLPATSVSQARQLTIIFGDEETTAIHTVQSRPRETGIYNLQGQRVKTPGKGLYIINGKKVFIK